MRKPLVSIIMGAYNCSDSISFCIESVICQTYKNWELIICDDCSDDNTIEIIKEYMNKDNRIRLIRNNQNLKLAASLNNCLDCAKGQYIARLDADDICLKNRIEVQVRFLNEHVEYAVVGSAAQIYDGNQIVGVRKCKEKPTRNDVLRGPTFMHPTIMMRKEVYDDLRGYTVAKRTNRGQDWDLWFRFYAKGYCGYNLQEVLYVYHESQSDYKKRTLKTAKMYAKTALFGYRLLNVPIYKYIYAIKPFLAVVIPWRFKTKIHSQ